MPRPTALYIDNPKVWEDMVKTHMPFVGNLCIVTKDNATIHGARGISIGFEVLMGTNKIPVYATMPLDSFMGMVEVINNHYTKVRQ